MSLVTRPLAGPGLPSSIRPSNRPSLAGPSSPRSPPQVGGRETGRNYSGRSRSLGRKESDPSSPLRQSSPPNRQERYYDSTTRNVSQRREESTVEIPPVRGRRAEFSGTGSGAQRSKSQHSSRNHQHQPLNSTAPSLRYDRQAQSPASSPSAASASSLWDRSAATSSSTASSVDDSTKETSISPTDGLSSLFWNKMASATSNVKNLVFQGDVSHNGFSSNGESELSIAMKRYWIGRVKRTQDLPSWLFSDYERQVEARQPPSVTSDYPITHEMSNSGGDKYRDIKPRQPPRGDMGTRSNPDPDVKLSRAATRLRAMADAKRSVPIRGP